MRTSRIFSVVVVLFLTSGLYGQSYYMYVNGEKRDYSVASNRVLVQSNCLNHDFLKINKMPKIIKNPTNLENLIEITVQTNTDKILIP